MLLSEQQQQRLWILILAAQEFLLYKQSLSILEKEHMQLYLRQTAFNIASINYVVHHPEKPKVDVTYGGQLQKLVPITLDKAIKIFLRCREPLVRKTGLRNNKAFKGGSLEVLACSNCLQYPIQCLHNPQSTECFILT